MSNKNQIQKQLTNFPDLIKIINDTHNQLSSQAKKAVNTYLTIRNWLIGYYISEYELKGDDRANYGDKLLNELSLSLGRLKISNCNKRQLYDYINFYLLILKLRPQCRHNSMKNFLVFLYLMKKCLQCRHNPKFHLVSF